MLRIGTSGFSFPDWVGPVYPIGLPQREMLIHYQNHLGFDCVEINATYYRLASEKMFVGMERKTSPDFEFVIKGYRGITHDPFDNRLKDKQPSMDQVALDAGKFLYSLRPLQEANKLGGVLLQYPVFFWHNRENREYILQCRDWLKGVPLIIEFRNNGWANRETYEFLKKHNIGFCVVDEPQLPRLMPFVNKATSDIGYLRLHGRNKNWFNVPMSERYNYLYNDDELKTFIPEIKKLAGQTQTLYIFFNNCHVGSAAKNALRLKEMLKGETQLFQ